MKLLRLHPVAYHSDYIEKAKDIFKYWCPKKSLDMTLSMKVRAKILKTVRPQALNIHLEIMGE